MRLGKDALCSTLVSTLVANDLFLIGHKIRRKGIAELFRLDKHDAHAESAMSALGQKRTSELTQSMSALPPKADITERGRHVRFVPKADICAAANSRYSIASSASRLRGMNLTLLALGKGPPLLRGFWHTDCLVAGMADEDYLMVLLQIVCLLMFCCGAMVLTHHPEWFGA